MADRSANAESRAKLESQIVDFQRKEQAACSNIALLEQEKQQLIQQGGSAAELLSSIQDQLRASSLQVAELTGCYLA